MKLKTRPYGTRSGIHWRGHAVSIRVFGTLTQSLDFPKVQVGSKKQRKLTVGSEIAQRVLGSEDQALAPYDTTNQHTHSIRPPTAELHPGRAAAVCCCQPSGRLTELGWHPSPGDTHHHESTDAHTRLSLNAFRHHRSWGGGTYGTMQSGCGWFFSWNKQLEIEWMQRLKVQCVKNWVSINRNAICHP